MNSQPRNRGREPDRLRLLSWLGRAGLLATAVLVAAQPALAQAQVGGGSESIGSLPATAGSGPGAATASPNRLPFRLVLQGRQEELRALVLEARSLGTQGQGSWMLTPLQVPGMARLTFDGALELSLDRHRLEQSFVSVSVELGSHYSGGALSVSAGGLRGTRSIGSPQVDLHLQQMSWSGLLDKGVALQALTPWKEKSRLTLTATADTILLVQIP